MAGLDLFLANFAKPAWVEFPGIFEPLLAERAGLVSVLAVTSLWTKYRSMRHSLSRPGRVAPSKNSIYAGRMGALNLNGEPMHHEVRFRSEAGDPPLNLCLTSYML